MARQRNNVYLQIYGHLLHDSNMSDVQKEITKLQKLTIVSEFHLAESETKNASDEWVAIEENNDGRLAILSSLLDEDGDIIE